MNSRQTGLILAGLLLVAGLATAQPGAPPKPDPGIHRGQSDDPPAPGARAQMYEDVEILRRLLNSKLLSEYPPAKALAEAQGPGVPYGVRLLQQHGFTPQAYQLQPESGLIWNNLLQPYNQLQSSNNPNGAQWYFPVSNDYTWTVPNQGPARVLDTEGTYLKSQGVVYTLTLPPPARNPKEPSSKPAPPSVSDWDRIRGELHNEKPRSEAEEERKGQPRKEPSLAEIILKVLADNGRYFLQLGDDESLTVIVTFRGDDPPPAKKADPEKPKRRQNQKPNQPPSEEDKGKGATPQGSSSNAHDYELLAELHLKQGKYEEAEKALRQALELKPDAKQMAGLYRKLAEMYLGVGRDAEARQAIDKAMELAKAGQSGSPEPAKQPKPAHSPLPAKLIVSAPKKLLGQVGSGKITFEEFQKAATVDYLTFPAAKD